MVTVSLKCVCVVLFVCFVIQAYGQMKAPLKPFVFKPPPKKGPIWKSGDWSLGKGGLNWRRWSLGGDGLKHTFRNGVSVFGKPDMKFSFKKPFVKVDGFRVGVRIPLRRRRSLHRLLANRFSAQ